MKLKDIASPSSIKALPEKELKRLASEIRAEIIRTVKSSTSRWINETNGNPFWHFGWQDGYGAFSVSNSHVDAVVAYIKGQEEHHKRVSFEDEFRRICELYNVTLDERYAWD